MIRKTEDVIEDAGVLFMSLITAILLCGGGKDLITVLGLKEFVKWLILR